MFSRRLSQYFYKLCLGAQYKDQTKIFWSGGGLLIFETCVKNFMGLETLPLFSSVSNLSLTQNLLPRPCHSETKTPKPYSRSSVETLSRYVPLILRVDFRWQKERTRWSHWCRQFFTPFTVSPLLCLFSSGSKRFVWDGFRDRLTTWFGHLPSKLHRTYVPNVLIDL